VKSLLRWDWWVRSKD